MKSQDIFLCFKLISLENRINGDRRRISDILPHVIESIDDGSTLLQGEDYPFDARSPDDHYTLDSLASLREAGEFVRWEFDQSLIDQWVSEIRIDAFSLGALAISTGLSKTEVHSSLKRLKAVGLVTESRKTKAPTVNRRAVLNIVSYAIKYVFPATPGAVVRGIPTAFAAPILKGKVMSAGDLIPVWPDAHGSVKGQSVEPLFKSVPGAVKRDLLLYHFLALIDAIRIGGHREASIANAMLREWVME